MKVSYVYFAEHLEDMYNQFCEKNGKCTRFQYLAKVSNALDNSTNIMTLDSVKSMSVLSNKISKWNSMQTGLSLSETESVGNLVALIGIAQTVYEKIIQKGETFEEVFNDGLQVDSFTEVRESLIDLSEVWQNEIVKDKLLSALPIEINTDLGNIFEFCTYQNGILINYPAHSSVDNVKSAIKTGYFVASSFASFDKLLEAFRGFAVTYSNIAEVFKKRIMLIEKLQAEFKNSACIVVFTDSCTKKMFPYKTASVKRVSGIDSTSTLDKVANKRVTVYFL